MKMIVFVALALVAAAAAAPTSDQKEFPKIVRSELRQTPEGGYVSITETEDGIYKEETGELKQVLDEDNKTKLVLVVRGVYSYPGEDGKRIEIVYSADETGFHPEGDSIPKVAGVPARR